MRLLATIRKWLFERRWPEGGLVSGPRGFLYARPLPDQAVVLESGFRLRRLPSSETLTDLLNERDALARSLAAWRLRWDRAVIADRGAADDALAGLRPLDDYAYDLAYSRQAEPKDVGGGTQPARSSTSSSFQ